MSRLGFGVRIDEVTQYKQSVMENEDVGELISIYFPESFTQWSAGNINHNVKTLDGKSPLHALGIVCSTTSMHRSGDYSKMRSIQHLKIKKVANLIKNKGIAVTTIFHLRSLDYES